MILLAAAVLSAASGCGLFSSGNAQKGSDAQEDLKAEGSPGKSGEKEGKGTEDGGEDASRTQDGPAQEMENRESVRKKDILVAVDPGHQAPGIDMSGLEENAPGSSVLKAKATTGTAGSFTGIPEYELNLDISLMLRTELEERGYDVLLTREDNETAVSNAQRAQMANDAGADIAVRIHANGSGDPGVSGALVLTGSAENPYVGNLFEESTSLGNAVLDSYCVATGMENLGVRTDDTMTGINWSKIPVIILEMGFMTNEQDDRNMADENFRSKMVKGIADGIDGYFRAKEEAKRSGLESLIREKIRPEEEKAAGVSVFVARLDSASGVEVNSGPMESASLIKLYIAGSVYEHYEQVKSREEGEGETDVLISRMLSVSDNDAANTLVTRLGEGNAKAGMDKVTAFCAAHGYTDTSMGRLMLETGADRDNYTSVRDCGKFLRDISEGRLEGSEEILDCLKAQERTGKIPAGVPEGVETANKTGELDDVENDAAVIYGEKGAYILCVMTDQLAEAQSAREMITELSAGVYEYMQAW